MYVIVRKFTVRKKFQIIVKFKKGHRILDVGCGTGELLAYFKKRRWETVGIETNSNARDYGITHYGLDVGVDLKTYKSAPESFDVITLWHVLEHLPDIHEQLRKIISLLKSNGILIAAVPNCNAYDAQYYQEFWAAYDVPRHLYHFTKQTLSYLLELHGCHIIEVFPMKLDAYYVSMLSEKYKHGKPHHFHGFIRGVISNLKAFLKGKEYSSMIYVIKKNIQ
ncbi:MAG: class I SAM-dependent methyltransferase [Bacteroidetes bacterium]|nr:class I SAM-dependent methyltransferase [Bacteroidota bacterium]